MASAELSLLAGAQRVEGTLFGNGERTFPGKFFGSFFHPLCTLHCNIDDFFPVHAEHYISLKGRCGIVDMDNRLATAGNGFREKRLKKLPYGAV